MRKVLLAAILASSASVCPASDFNAADNNETPVIKSLAVDASYVWAATDRGLLRFDKATGESTYFSDDRFENLSVVGVSGEGEVAVGAAKNRGVAYFSGSDFQWLPTEEGLSINDPASIVFADGLWVGCQLGVMRHDGDAWKHYFIPEVLVSGNFIYESLVSDEASGRIWYGAKGTMTSCNFGYITEEAGMVAMEGVSSVNDMSLASDGVLYIATDKGMYRCENDVVRPFANPFDGQVVKCRFVDSAGNRLWFGDEQTIVERDGDTFASYRYEIAPGFYDIILASASDGESLWLAFSRSGLVKFSGGVFDPVSSSVDGVVSESGNEGDGPAYDLGGNLLENPAKGQIYIKGGKARINR